MRADRTATGRRAYTPVTMMRFVPLADLGVQPSLGGRQLLLMSVAVAPLVLLASALQMFVATVARSFKEAQTYVSLLIFVPISPAPSCSSTRCNPPAG